MAGQSSSGAAVTRGTMRIGIFAAEVVGLEIARFLGQKGADICCLVVDPADRSGLNRQIITACGPQDMGRILTNDRRWNSESLESMRGMGLDLGILAWWPYILPGSVLNIPRLGFLNLHPSLLPHCRGKDPNFWAIVEEAPYGVTIHWVEPGIDSGDIAFQAKIPVSWEDTGQTLYKKAQDRIVELFVQNFDRIQRGDIPRSPQPTANASFHRRHELDTASRIDLDKQYTGREIVNLLRARTFPPHPGSYFEDNGRTYQARISIEGIDLEGLPDG